MKKSLKTSNISFLLLFINLSCNTFKISFATSISQSYPSGNINTLEENQWTRKNQELVLTTRATLATTTQCPNSCNCPNQAILFCSDAQLWRIPDTMSSQLTHALLDGNHIADVQQLAFYNSRFTLTELMLEENEIRMVDIQAFAGLSQLRVLSLNDNKLKYLGSGIFEPLIGLERLDLARNRIDSLLPHQFKSLSNLKELKLEQNNIRVLRNNTFRGLGNVTSLYLGQNEISIIEAGAFSGLHSLRFLYLENNLLLNLPNISAGELPNLEKLIVKGNRLGRIEAHAFTHLPKIKSLHLQDNEIGFISDDAFAGVRNVDEIRLRNNSITVFPLGMTSGLAAIEILDLGVNLLQRIPRKAFASIHISSLYLDNNEISEIDSEAFLGIEETSHLALNISSNKLQVLNATTFKYPVENLQSFRLYVKGNPLHCNCHMKGFYRWLKSSQLNGKNELVCQSPMGLKGNSIHSIPSEDRFICSPPEQVTHFSQAWALQGRGVVLPCAVYSDPRPQFSWYLPGVYNITFQQGSMPPRVNVEQDGTLGISSVLETDGGRWTCRARNTEGMIELQVTLTVIPESSSNHRLMLFFSAGMFFCSLLFFIMSGYIWFKKPHVIGHHMCSAPLQSNGATYQQTTELRLTEQDQHHLARQQAEKKQQLIAAPPVGIRRSPSSGSGKVLNLNNLSKESSDFTNVHVPITVNKQTYI